MLVAQKLAYGTTQCHCIAAPLRAATCTEGVGFLAKFAPCSGISLSAVVVVVAVVFPAEGAKEQD